MTWLLRIARTRCAGVPLGDLMLATALAIAAVVTTIPLPHVTHPWTELVDAAAGGSVALRRRAPLAMAGIAAAALVVLALLPGASTPMWAFVAVLLIAFSAGAHPQGRRAALAVGLLLAASYVIQFVTDPDTTERLVTPPVLIGAPALAGWLLRRSREQSAALHRLATELAGEQERRAEAVAAAERTRIARELHDVIAHSVSVMVVQAAAAEQLMSTGDPALGHVHAVRSAGRDALAELRRSLGLLREDRPGPTAPQPTLADLAGLTDGADATLTTLGSPPADAPPGLQLTVFRIVQEALTNARRHAPGATVQVRADYTDPAAIRVVVEDDGARPGAGPRLAVVDGGAGHGLTGMTERAELFGGSIVAGPRSGAPGWQVRAELPLSVVSARDEEIVAS